MDLAVNINTIWELAGDKKPTERRRERYNIILIW